MATATSTTALSVDERDPTGSRAARRLRREGKVPGVVYGGGADPIAFEVDARLLRNTLAHAGALLDLSIGGAAPVPVVLKEHVRHPVNGETIHLDFLRVRLDQAIQATVLLELTGGEDAPGLREGGVLEHTHREVTIEALPTDIPDLLQHDISGMQIGDTLTIEALTPPAKVTIVDDPETVVATITPPRLQAETAAEIEEETELVADAEAAEEASEDEAESGGEEASDGE
jgi:large subunit ribosomal protein L25